MQDWEKSSSNPLVCARLAHAVEHADDKKAIKKGHAHDSAPADEDRSKKPWLDNFIIQGKNPVYIAFNIFICVLCIVSSYYYASFIGFRYQLESDEQGKEETKKMMIAMIIFESFFLVHFLL
jgi:hypothetical protein